MAELAVHSEVAVVEPRQVATMNHPDVAPPLHLNSYGLTDRGRVRASNEDQFLIASLVKALRVHSTSLPQPRLQHSRDQSYLFVVADGMGGHAGGEQASALAIDSVESFVLETFKWFAQVRGQDPNEVLTDFQSALAQANSRVLAEAREHPEWHGMGTTLTMAYSLNDKLYVAHVGDSRCYLYRNGILHRVTSDHTLVEDMVRVGALPAEDASTHRWRHVITNVVGGDSTEIKVELHRIHIEAGDTVLLCSDGLTEMLSEHAISDVLGAEGDPKEVCNELVTRANEAGGKDNITVILAKYE
jgi:PPM family protein phosphatase